jgi:hypothetical protein
LFRVQLTNHNNHPIHVVGGTTTCSCITTLDLPLQLPEKSTGSINVALKFVGSPGRFQRSFVLYTDDERQPIAVARFSGRVIAPMTVVPSSQP